ncbi:MAG: hypothetical protein ABIP94_25245 [Planctomycetota bacterium]
MTQITCDNCGAKGKLPASFTGTQAKCPKCGSAIDVQKQKAAATSALPAASAAAAAKPAAAARPAIDRSKDKPAERPARAERSKTRGKDTSDDDGKGKDAESKGRRGRSERPAKKSNAMPIILSVAGVVVLGVGAVIFMNRDDKPATEQAAKNHPAVKPVDKPVEATPPPPEEPAAKPLEPAPAAKAAEASTPPVDPPKDDGDPNRVKRPWEKMKNPPQSMDQVTDPKTYPEVTWPASIDDVKKATVRALVEDIAGGGRAGIQAKPKLVDEHDYAGLFAVVEKLRLLDYRSAEESMVAFEFNKLLEQLTGGQNARFEPVEITETIAPAKAQWNTMSVKAWIVELAKYPDAEALKKARAELQKKQAQK